MRLYSLYAVVSLILNSCTHCYFYTLYVKDSIFEKKYIITDVNGNLLTDVKVSMSHYGHTNNEDEFTAAFLVPSFLPYQRCLRISKMSMLKEIYTSYRGKVSVRFTTTGFPSNRRIIFQKKNFHTIAINSNDSNSHIVMLPKHQWKSKYNWFDSLSKNNFLAKENPQYFDGHIDNTYPVGFVTYKGMKIKQYLTITPQFENFILSPCTKKYFEIGKNHR